MTLPLTKLLLLSEAMAQMPGVKTRSTKDLIKSWERKTGGVRSTAKGIKVQKRQAVDIGGLTIEPDVLFEMHYSDGAQGGKDAVSPRAAKILIELYLCGRLETKTKPVTLEGVGQELIDYSKSKLTLKEILNAGKAEEDRKREARLARLNRPLGQIRESELTESFLHDLFLHHKVSNGALTVAGLEISKTLTRSSSNSGKSHDWNESFSWTGSNGEPHHIASQGAFSANRRNDADRNWGLGPE